MLAATGMEYREHPAPGVADHTGAGVYYGAATTEAPAFSGRRVLVVGGGNSAGQAAMYLARYAKDVQIVVRRDSLRDTMSRYLIEQIEKTPNIRLRTRTELERVEGDGHVERVALKLDDGASEVEDDRRGVRVHRHQAAKRLASRRRAARRQGVRDHRPGSVGGRRLRAHLEGAPRADGRSRPARPACSRPATSAPAR